VIEIKNLEFHYSRKRPIYNDLGVSIKEGSICGLLGLNGAGKTTLLNVIAGFLIPQNGTCKVFGMEASERKPEMLQEVFIVSDTSDLPYINLNTFCKTYADFYPRFDHDFFNHCVSEFKVSTKNRLISLSLGDKRKAMLSFALSTRCRLLLLDEPTNGLDIPSKSVLKKLIAESFNEKQTILIATHQLRDLSNLMDRIIIEHHGRIVLNESIDCISEKLLFGVNEHLIPKEDLIYLSEGLTKYETVSVNRTKEQGQIDVELLFAAATANPNEFKAIFTLEN